MALVRRRTEPLLDAVRPGATVLVSSQVPVGFTRALTAGRPAGVRVGYSPENLRLGKALESFRSPARVVVGTDDGRPKIFRDSAVDNLQEFFERFRHLNTAALIRSWASASDWPPGRAEAASRCNSPLASRSLR